MVDNDGPAEHPRDDDRDDRDGGAVTGTAGERGTEELLTRLAGAERARDEAESARDEAVRRADALAAALEEARAQPVETFGMRADKVVRMAEHDAAQRRRAAEQEADALHERAREQASRIVADARAEAERVAAAAHAEAERVAADAAGERDRLHAAGVAARRDSELVADTAASMHAHVSAVRDSVRDEVARLHAVLGAELGRLDGPEGPPAARDRPAAGAATRPPRTGGAHTLRDPADGGPATGDLPPVSLPAQRAGAGAAEDPATDDPAAEGSAPARAAADADRG